MTATNKSKEIRAKRRYMLEAFVKTGMTSLEALKAIYRLTGGVKGIKPETLQAHKFDTEYKPYTDGIFDGAINAGAPIKTVKGHWRTVGYKQDGTPISLGAYLVLRLLSLINHANYFKVSIRFFDSIISL